MMVCGLQNYRPVSHKRPAGRRLATSALVNKMSSDIGLSYDEIFRRIATCDIRLCGGDHGHIWG